MLWLVALTFYVLYRIALKAQKGLKQKMKSSGGPGGGKKRDWSWVPSFLCRLLWIWAFVYAPLPFGWGTIAGRVSDLFGWVLGALGGFFGVSAGPLAAVAVLGLVLAAAWDIGHDAKPDGVAKTAVWMVPVLVLVASGPIAPLMEDLIHTINGSSPRLVAFLTGSG